MSVSDGYLCNQHRREGHEATYYENCVACAYETGARDCARMALLRLPNDEEMVHFLRGAAEEDAT